MGRGCHLCCLCYKLVIFNRSRVCCSKSFMPINQAKKKACMRPCDTNSFNQSLTRKYHHTATEDLYHLFSEKISWVPTFAGVSYQFGFVPFLIFLEWKISRSSVFSFFSHEVSRKVRKVTDSNFTNKFKWVWLGGHKSP